MLPRQNTCIRGNGDSDMPREDPVEWEIHLLYFQDLQGKRIQSAELSTAFQSHIQLVLCSAFPSRTSFLVPPTLEGTVERPFSKPLEQKEKGYLWTVLMGSGVGMELLRTLLKCPFQHFPVSNSVLCLYKSHLLGKGPSVFIHT